VVVVVSLCVGEGAVVEVVVTVLCGAGVELNEMQPVSKVDAKMTAIKF